MEFDENIPWWQSALRAFGLLVGLAALSVVLMGGIIFIARYFDKTPAARGAPPVRLDLSTPAQPEQNAKTREKMPYGPISFPNSPGRPAAYNGSSDRGSRSNLPSQTAEPEPPVGVSVEEYRTAVESGKKVYLPNPKGECDLSGASVAKSMDALENCFAQRAAR